MLTKLYLANLILLMLLATVGCNGDTAATNGKGVVRASGVDGDAPDNDVSEVVAKGDQKTLLSGRYPINQFECRDQIIALAKEIKRISEASSKSEEQRFADFSIYVMRVGDNSSLLSKYCREDQDKIFRQRLDFLIALHRPISAIWVPGKKGVIKGVINTSVGEMMIDARNPHDKFLELIIRNKKPEFFKQVGIEGLDKFVSEVIDCRDGFDWCERVAQLPLADGITDPISFCADYVEKYYRNVMEPRQQADSSLSQLDEGLFDKIMKGTGGVPLNVLHPIRGDKNKREAMIRLVERHNPDNAKELRKWVIEKRRRYLQQTQESAKQQLVLVQRADVEFRKTDANGNGVEDYWVADISGLYRLQRAKAKTAQQDGISLIDLFLVHLDASPLPDSTDGCVDLPALPPGFETNIFPYRLQAVKRDAAGREVAVDTDGSGRKWFNKDQFAFCACPMQYPRLGRNTYLIDEAGQLWMKDTQGNPVAQRPADYDAEGWSKTKITPQYVKQTALGQRVTDRFTGLQFQLEQREKLLKAGVIKKPQKKPAPNGVDIPAPDRDQAETATFGAGAFWLNEAVFEQLDGVLAVDCGYTGGHVENPTYAQVSSGKSGHAEVCRIRYDPNRIQYKELLEVFWKMHDPTSLNRQGNDIGPQYRSVIFFHNQQQKTTAEMSRSAVEKSNAFSKPLATKIESANKFYIANTSHQDYFLHNPTSNYCINVIAPRVENIRKMFPDKIADAQAK